jgi:lysophospholipid acyltransferase (LPLAT)-like uncharacterized protein
MAERAPLSVIAAVPELDGGQSCDRFSDRLLKDAANGHVIVPFWSAHQLTIALLAGSRSGLRPALARFEVVADNSFGGEIMRGIGEGFDLKMRPIHTRGNPKRLEDVGAWMRNPAPFFIAVDGGAHYGTVPTGIIRMAARLGSVLWPLAVRVRPVMHVPGLIADIPLPGCHTALAIAEPLRVERTLPVATGAAILKERLDAASQAGAAELRRTRIALPTTHDPHHG